MTRQSEVSQPPPRQTETQADSCEGVTMGIGAMGRHEGRGGAVYIIFIIGKVLDGPRRVGS